MRSYPPSYEVAPTGRVVAVVVPPGSKSLTNRALLVAALAEGVSDIRRPLRSDDTEAMRDCLARLGVEVTTVGDDFGVSGTGRLTPRTRVLDARGSGTTARFITAAATIADGEVIVDGNDRMRERPIGDLVDALEQLGADVEIIGSHGCPPVRVRGPQLAGGPARIDASRSSQYVSAIMMAAPYATDPVTLRLGGPVVSRPYIQSTIDVMAAFGVEAVMRGDAVRIPLGRYAARDYVVEPDASAAAYPWAAAAITGGSVTIGGISPTTSQADIGFLGVLEAMGCSVTVESSTITVAGPEALAGVDLDMNHCPDAVLAAAVVASFAAGPTTIRNVGNLRIKETDRLTALETELRRLGHHAATGDDWLQIVPGSPHGAVIKTYDDHRMAMSFALAGLVVPGVIIDEPGCVAKTWPRFFDELERW